jgi:hypothetical protein
VKEEAEKRRAVQRGRVEERKGDVTLVEQQTDLG